MPNINKIKLSGTSYDIQDSNATKTVTLTQAEYDALQTKDPNTFYIISDGETFDPSEKVDTSAFTAYSASVETALSGKVDVTTFETYSGNVNTALSGKQNTLSAGTGIDITNDVISATGGGGKAVSAGTNISVTTGETADTINCTLPISKGSGNNNSLILGTGNGNTASGQYSIAVGGKNNSSSKYCSLVGGNENNVSNEYETAFGNSNKTNYVSTTFGNSGNTLFSVGNGSNYINRHNAFEIRQDGSIYIPDLSNDTSYRDRPMIKLQDALGGGGITSVTAVFDSEVTPNEFYLDINNGDSVSQIFKVGSGLTVTEDGDDKILSATGGGGGGVNVVQTTGTSTTDVMSQDAVTTQLNNLVETSAITTSVTSSSTDAQVPSAKAVNDKLGGLSIVKLTQAQYDALSTKDSNTLYVITNS